MLKKKIKMVPLETNYIFVVPKIIKKFSPEKISEFKKDLMLQAQGEIVKIENGLPAIISALTFSVLYEVSLETVFDFGEEKYLLFDNHKSTTVRSKEINENIWKEVLKAKKEVSIAQEFLAILPKNTINLAVLWERLEKTGSLEKDTKLFIKEYLAYLTPASELYLKGDLPSFLLMVAICLARPSAKNIYYSDNKEQKVIL